MAKLTKNFRLQEFYCNDGTEIPNKYLTNVIELAENLQVLRDYIDKPIHINSAYRHEIYNKSIGGSKKSQHLKAKASDIRVDGMNPSKVYIAIEKLIKEGKMKQGGLGLYPSFVHYDIRGKKTRW